MDYIFCPDCEKMIGICLEHPYSEYLRNPKKEIQSHVPYFFWVSVVFRLIIAEQCSSKIPDKIKDNLRECLYEYLHTDDKKVKSQAIIEKCDFSYRLLWCPSYQYDGSEFICASYNDGQLILNLGGMVVLVNFDRINKELLNVDGFDGLQDDLNKINDGSKKETFISVSTDSLKKYNQKIIEIMSQERIKYDLYRVQGLLNFLQIGEDSEAKFKQIFFEKLYSERSKIGNRITDKYFIQCFLDTYKELQNRNM